jgi:hypothetical protein
MELIVIYIVVGILVMATIGYIVSKIVAFETFVDHVTRYFPEWSRTALGIIYGFSWLVLFGFLIYWSEGK